MRRLVRSSASFGSRFGENLARHREAAGISQELLAALADLHRTAVGQLERGERVARCDTLVKLAAALRIDPRALLKGIAWTPPEVEFGSFDFADEPRSIAGAPSEADLGLSDA